MYDVPVRHAGNQRYKTCIFCDQKQVVNEFWHNAVTGYRSSECRTCAAERERCWAEVTARGPEQGVWKNRMVDHSTDEPLACRKCGRTRPRTSFYTVTTPGGKHFVYRANCKQCSLALNREWNNQNRGQRKENPETRRRMQDSRMRKAYGIGLDEYEAILESQGGVCAVCRTAASGNPDTRGKALHVDHDHDTGAVRGLLCRPCNTSLGLMKEDPARIQSMLIYLASYTKPTSEAVA